MGITLPTIGQSAWGGPLNDAISPLAHGEVTPDDSGYQSWNYDHIQIGALGGNLLTSGTIKTCKLQRFAKTLTLTGLGFCIGAAAVTPTAGQCFVALYNSAGTRVAVSADISGNLATVGLIKYPFTASYVAVAGDYIAAILVNAATPPSLGCSASVGNTSVANSDLTTTTARFANGPTTQTSMPTSITLASRTLSQVPNWVGAY